jgi:hypothetical protein
MVRSEDTRPRRRHGVRGLIVLLVVAWLVIGAAAAAQRHYFTGAQKPSCAKLSTTTVTVIAGPLNYVGANPKIKCKAPQPTK